MTLVVITLEFPILDPSPSTTYKPFTKPLQQCLQPSLFLPFSIAMVPVRISSPFHTWLRFQTDIVASTYDPFQGIHHIGTTAIFPKLTSCQITASWILLHLSLISKVLWKGGRERKRNSEEKSYKTWEHAGWVWIRKRGDKYKPVVGALISSKIQYDRHNEATQES